MDRPGHGICPTGRANGPSPGIRTGHGPFATLRRHINPWLTSWPKNMSKLSTPILVLIEGKISKNEIFQSPLYCGLKCQIFHFDFCFVLNKGCSHIYHNLPLQLWVKPLASCTLVKRFTAALAWYLQTFLILNLAFLHAPSYLNVWFKDMYFYWMLLL